MKRIHVAAGVILDADGRVLIARRPEHLHKGGLWEFPGGKREQGETVASALSRELAEELAISVLKAEPLLQVAHDYPEKQVLLDVWVVRDFSGEAKGNEGQAIAWVSAAQLSDYQFPEANEPIIEAVRSMLIEINESHCH